MDRSPGSPQWRYSLCWSERQCWLAFSGTPQSYWDWWMGRVERGRWGGGGGGMEGGMEGGGGVSACLDIVYAALGAWG